MRYLSQVIGPLQRVSELPCHFTEALGNLGVRSQGRLANDIDGMVKAWNRKGRGSRARRHVFSAVCSGCMSLIIHTSTPGARSRASRSLRNTSVYLLMRLQHRVLP